MSVRVYTNTHSSNRLENLKYEVLTSLVTWKLLTPVTKTVFVFFCWEVLLKRGC